VAVKQTTARNVPTAGPSGGFLSFLSRSGFVAGARTRLPLAFFALAWLTGASVWLQWPTVSERMLLILFVLAAGIIALILGMQRYSQVHFKPHSTRPVSLLVAVLLFLASGLFGAVWTGYAAWQQSRVLQQETHRIMNVSRQRQVSGTIHGLPTQKVSRAGRQTRFVFKTDEAIPRKYLLSWYRSEQTPQPGERWQLTVKLKPPHGYANPAGFDYPKWLFRQGIVATGWVTAGEKLADTDHRDLLAQVHRIRAGLRQWIEKTLPPGPSRALVLALAIGDRSQLSPDDYRIFRTTGTAHLIAISGLHIGLAAMLGAALGWLVYFFFPRQRLPRALLQAVLGVLFAVLYAALAGFSVATVRALVAVMAIAAAVVTRRRLSPWDYWALALLLVLVIDPLAVLDNGFWLSFMAVAALIAALAGTSVPVAEKSQPPASEGRRWHRMMRSLKTLGRAQLAILLGLLPLSVLIFHQIQWLAPVVNFLLIPLVSVTLVPVLGLALLAHAVIGLTTVDEKLLSLAGQLSNGLLAVLQPLSHWPHVTASVSTPSIYWLIAWLLALGLWFFAPARRWRIVGLAVLAGLLLALLHRSDESLPADSAANSGRATALTAKAEPAGDFTVRVLDVGQGLAVLVETGGHRLLYDTGAAFDSGFNLADAVVLPYLRQRHIDALDRLVLSHRDNDHAGAAATLLAALSVKSLWTTFPYAGAEECVAPRQWQWDGVTFTVLSPYNLTPYLGNNSSCVLRIHSAYGAVLLTGDVESAVEYRLQAAQQRGDINLQSDVLLVPHHGSATSSSLSFLQAVKPQWAVNASGFFNAFGHPKAAIVARYRQAGIQWLDTQNSGLISLHFSAAGISVSEYRRRRPARLWRLQTEPSPAATGKREEVETDESNQRR
jgi:competence protein ComEC